MEWVQMRKTYDKAFKAKVALEAIKGEKTIQQIAQDFEIHQLYGHEPPLFTGRKQK
jgi:transposase-like protein